MQKLFLILFLSILFGLCGRAQESIETGRLPIKNYSSTEYNALPQNFAICEDQRGVIYLGNRDGLIEYDGINWQKTKLPNKDMVRSLLTGSNGTVYVGGNNELGYLHPNENGLLIYSSLLDKIPDSLHNFGNVWNILETIDGIFFQTNQHFFIYKNDSIYILNNPKEKFYTSFKVNGELIVHDKNHGLFRYKNQQLQPIKGSEPLNDVYAVLKLNKQELLVATRGNGLMRIPAHISDISHKIRPFKTTVNNFLIENRCYNGLIINDSLFSFGTMGGGMIVINKNGGLKKILNKSTGIIDESIQFQFLDKNNSLWLATNNGISRVEINSPISFYDKNTGMVGGIVSIAKRNQSIYTATRVGVIKQINYSSKDLLESQGVSKLLFDNIGTKEEYWDILTMHIDQEELLLVNSNDIVYQVLADDQFKNIYDEKTPYSLYNSRIQSNRLYVGLYKGLVSLLYLNGKWVVEKYFDEVQSTIIQIREDKKGNLWLSAGSEGLILIQIDFNNKKINNYTVEFFNEKNGLDKSPYKPNIVSDSVYFGTGSGIYEFNWANKTINPQTRLGKNFDIGARYIHRMEEDPNGNIWLATWVEETNKDEIGIARKLKNGYFYEKTPLNTISAKGIIHAIYHDNNNITWLGGPEGLFKFNGNIYKNYKIPYHALVRKVIIGKDSVLFHGTYFDENKIPSLQQPKSLKKVLEYKYNSVTFEFAAVNTNVEFPLQFSFFLEGNDKEWSNWSDKTYKDYTNLAEGNYSFKVKAKDIYDFESTVASYSFTVLPPWYRTILAYIAYVVLATAFVYMVVVLYTRKLRQIIRERTAEIRKQKEEIEEINEHILDSIKYAKRIQTALLPGENLREPLNEHFVLFKPRDIVSGDYYWMSHRNHLSFIVAADCTGHGVPGAFMSMLGMSFLNEIVNKSAIIHTDEILNKLRESVIGALKQTGKEGEAKDGMDLALYVWDREKNTIEFSGANNPLYYTRPMTVDEKEMAQKGDESFLEKGEIHDEKNLLKQIKADKMPIGIYAKKDVPFQKSTLQADVGYTFYTFSDGYVDQFGGPTGKKFMTKQFKRLLLSLYEKPMEDQRKVLDNAIEEWKGSKHEQVDDILVVGLRI